MEVVINIRILGILRCAGFEGNGGYDVWLDRAAWCIYDILAFLLGILT